MDGTQGQAAAGGEAYGQDQGSHAEGATEARTYAQGAGTSHAAVGDGGQRGTLSPEADALEWDEDWKELSSWGSRDEYLAAIAEQHGEAHARELGRLWGGDDLKLNVYFARRAAKAFVDEEIQAALEDAGLWNSVTLVKLAAAVGRMVSSAPGNPLGIPKAEEVKTAMTTPIKPAPPPRPVPTAPPIDRASVLDQIENMMARHGSPEYTSPYFQAKLQALYRRAYPGEAA